MSTFKARLIGALLSLFLLCGPVAAILAANAYPAVICGMKCCLRMKKCCCGNSQRHDGHTPRKEGIQSGSACPASCNKGLAPASAQFDFAGIHSSTGPAFSSTNRIDLAASDSHRCGDFALSYRQRPPPDSSARPQLS